jgi:NhaA family Na+:H+ antiporter
MTSSSGFIAFLQRYSVPLLLGVLLAMLAANYTPELYEDFQHAQVFGDASIFGHQVDLQFLVNDVFMAFFFGLATKEIVDACLQGGALSPPAKALNPLVACLGGVVGPIAVFFLGLKALELFAIVDDPWELSGMMRGWGVPCATDIALAWMFARIVFGAGHPAIEFLLLMAILDDAIGLGIIAIFYGDAAHPVAPEWLGLVAAGCVFSIVLRLARVQQWWPYILFGGGLAWTGMMLASLHPALALVAIVPCMPAGARDPLTGHTRTGFALADFERAFKLPVDLGLFFFALLNAGVSLSSTGPLSWVILGALAIGKTLGISLAALLGTKLGFPLPARVGTRELVLVGSLAGIGLTVALFMAGEAFTHVQLEQQAKMGAALSFFLGLLSLLLARALGVRPSADSKARG